MPLSVSWTASSSVWIQMLPPLAYTIEPSNAASSGMTTTFDGAGGPGWPAVAVAVAVAIAVPAADPERDLAVEQVERDDAR